MDSVSPENSFKCPPQPRVFRWTLAAALASLVIVSLVGAFFTTVNSARWTVWAALGCALLSALVLLGFTLRDSWAHRKWRKEINLAFEELGNESRETVTELERLRSIHDTQARLATLGELTVGLMHELNNPLSVVVGYNQLLTHALQRDSVDINAAKEFVYKTNRALAHMQKLIRNMRTAASGSSASEGPASEDLCLIATDLLGLFDEKIRSKRIMVQFEGFGNPQAVKCRAVELTQILLNLISNSLDALAGFNGAGQNQLFLRLVTERTGQDVLLHIEDSGPGVPEEISQKIMDPYFTTKPTHKGTGLGLSISQRLAQKNDGDLWLANPRNPTRFTLRLPTS